MTLLESGISGFSKNHEEDQWISDLIQNAICLLSLKPSAFSLFFIFFIAYTSFYYFFKKKSQSTANWHRGHIFHAEF